VERIWIDTICRKLCDPGLIYNKSYTIIEGASWASIACCKLTSTYKTVDAGTILRAELTKHFASDYGDLQVTR